MSDRFKCSFSIDHILNVAGGKKALSSVSNVRYDWLHCTRYKPPKLQRLKKKEGIQRRKPGRNPRIPFSSSQVALLEAKFLETPYLSSTDVTQLATCLRLSETRVKIWFQNRRARERRERDNSIKTHNSNVTLKQSEDSQKVLNNQVDLDIQAINETEESNRTHNLYGEHHWPQYFQRLRQFNESKTVHLLMPTPFRETVLLGMQQQFL